MISDHCSAPLCPPHTHTLFGIRISRSAGAGASHRGWETSCLAWKLFRVQSGEIPYVLTDSIKVILFIKIVIRSSEVSRQYSLNKNYEICILQGREAGNTDCVKTT